ncbi:cation:proton antiporter [Cryobacterium cryoconiti]|uniref:Sodium:proton exchanger n=1 Tax=Cryobacterium cryoconiti TaxID=1259239 RepID=A0A4Y8JYT0_9MICO|nr:cation:proton antiporter [Cryobacterium cryoconiti]TFD33483.1 sodium:proton exchanger [Cryobacterium cryoconiti]
MVVGLDPFATMAAVLTVAAIVAFIAHRARQPLIVAFILVGVIVGPSLLGWVEEKGTLELLAEIGIAILLFLVGLRLDIRLVKSIGRVALVTGLGQVLFTSLVGFGLALLFGMPVVVAAYVAVALTFSSTIIIVKLLSDKRELDELHGRIALGFLIVQDIVVIVVMIVLSSFGSERDGSLMEQILFVLLAAIGLIGGLAVAMRWVLPRLLTFVANSPELLIVCSIAWAVAVAALTDYLGFSVEVGAFLAGFALASTRFRESIASSLSGIRDFLLLFFFIALGAQLDFSSIGEQVPAALAFSAFVLIGNPLIVLVIMGVMGYPKRVSFLAGLAVAQISEFSLILVALGRDLGHVDNDTVGLVTLVGMITIGTSTYMILYSKQLFAVLEPVLGIFERRRTINVSLPEPKAYDVIVFGNGRFGRRLIEEFAILGYSVLVVDWDPYAKIGLDNAAIADRVSLVHGDARNIEFPASLPLRTAKWVVSTIPNVEINKVLAISLRDHGATAPIAVTVHREAEAAEFSREIDEKIVNLVLEPFDDAADDAIAALRAL